MFAVLQTLWKHHKSKDQTILHRNYIQKKISTPQKMYFFSTKKCFDKKIWKNRKYQISKNWLVLDPGLQGTGSAFRGRLRVVAFDPQWFFASTLMFEKISNFFWKWPKNIFGKNLKILKIPKKWDFWKFFDYFKKTSSIWACWGSGTLKPTAKSIKGMPRATFPWILEKLNVR